MKARNSLKLLIATLISALSMFAIANPVLKNVSSGSASVVQTGTTTTIKQTSNQTIINWNSFNISANEKTQFVQPSSNSVALNRISPDQGASQIFGALTANGQIILINAAGVHFGSGAMVDVGSVIVSTSDISDANFNSKKYIFDEPSTWNGKILNEGRIIAAQYGLVALVGNNVMNTGLIQAELGNIVLASGSKFTFDFYGDQLINFSVDAPADANGSVSNTGSLIADGGKVMVSADAAQGVVDDVVDMSGIVQAQSVGLENGEIVLYEQGDGTVYLDGKLDASGLGLGQTGGVVEVLGGNIHLGSNANIIVSGNVGGGQVYIGGSEHGVGLLPDALTVTVDSGAKINANAIASGNGGQVTVWSNDDTQFHGSITAEGGAAGGNGGNVETSGEYLDVTNAVVNLSAPHGLLGNWLLDPYAVTISSSASSPSFVNPYSQTSTSNLNVTDLTNALVTANVTVQAGGACAAVGGSTCGDIIVNSAIAWTSNSTLSLIASEYIDINAPITATTGGLTLSAFNDTQSLTAGTIGSGSSVGVAPTTMTQAIDVANFTLESGQWLQSATSLPAFTVADDFIISSGSTYNNGFAAQFTRLNTTSGNGISDIFGLQGIATGPLTTDYILTNNIDATVTQYWNSGAGFIPIGTAATPFTGTLNGSSNIYTINNLFINDSTDTYVGLLGYAHSTGVTIENLGLTNANITGSASGGAVVGGVAGDIQDQSVGNAIVSDVYVTGAVSATNGQAGGLVGNIGDDTTSVGGIIEYSFNTATVTASGLAGGIVGGLPQGSIQNSYNAGSVSGAFAGGIAGQGCGGCGVAATIQNSYNIGYVYGSSESGGLLGQNNGSTTFTNSYWDTQTSGQAFAQNNTSNPGGTSGKTTINLQGSAFTGFNGNSNWTVMTNAYPYLNAIYTSTPIVVSGYAPGAATDGTSNGLAGTATVSLAASTLAASTVSAVSSTGLSTGSTQTFNSGYYYFLEPSTVATNGSTILTYTTGANPSNGVDLYPASGAGGLAGLNLTAKQVTVGDTGTTGTTTLLSSTLAHAYLNSGSNLYTASGNNITLTAGDSLVTAVNTHESYTLDGNIIAPSNGLAANITFNEGVTLGSGTVLLQNASTGGSISLASTLNGNGDTLQLDTVGTGTITGIYSGASGSNLVLNPDSGYAGTLTLSNASNSYSGSTTIDAGTLNINSNTALGNSSTTIILGNTSANATLIDAPTGNGSDTISNAFSISGSGTDTIQYNGTGTFGLSGAINGAGSLTITTQNAVTKNISNNIGATIALTSLTLSSDGITNDGTDNFTGTIITTTGNQVFNDALTIGSSDTTFTTTGSGTNHDIQLSAVSWTTSNNLILHSGNNIYLKGNIYATSDGTTNGTPTGGLELFAVNGGQSLTGGTIGNGNAGSTPATITSEVVVNNFTLLQGQWLQNAASLPKFSVGNNFQISTSSTTYNSKFAAQFTRLNSTDLSGYNVIGDIYGLQGVATGPLNVNYSFGTTSDTPITPNAAITANWNGGLGFIPIGYGNQNSIINFYSGNFNGNNSVINNLTINGILNSSAADTGLFAILGGSGTISNLGLTNASITASKNATSDAEIGILLGTDDSSGTVSNVYATGTVTVTVNSGGSGVARIGGLIGEQKTGTISNAYSLATVNVNDVSAGIVTSGGFVASLAGGTLQSSFSAGSVNINNTGGSNLNYIGGFAGEAGGGFLQNDYSLTTVRASGTANSTTYVGGLTGVTGSSGTVTDNFSAGLVKNSTSSGSGLVTGGLVGSNGGSTNSGNFWDNQTSGQPSGVGSGSSTGIVGMSTTNMMTLANFNSSQPANGNSNPGWSIAAAPSSSTWGIISGYSYPYLTGIYGTATTPVVISGFVPGAATDGSSSGLSGTTVSLAIGTTSVSAVTTSGLTEGSVTSSSNGFYYFLEPNTVCGGVNCNGYTILTSTSNSNGVDLYPSSNAISGLNLAANTVTAGDVALTESLSNTTVANAYLSGTSLYTASGNNITLTAIPSTSFATASNSNLTYTINGTISASGSGANITFNAAPTLGSAAVVQDTSATGSITFPAITGAGNSLTIDTANTATISGIFSGTGSSLIVNADGSTGTLTLSNSSNSYTGATTIDAGTLSIAGSGALGNSSAAITIGSGSNNATLTDTSNSNPDTISNPFTITGTGTSTIQYTGTGSLALAGNINGSGAGTGNLTITSARTKNISGNIGASNSLATLSLAGGGTDNFTGTTITTSGNQTYSDAITLGSSATTFTTTGSGASHDITVNAQISWSGTNLLTLSSGNDVVLASNLLNPIINATGGGSLTLIAGDASANAIQLNGGITLTGGSTTSNGNLIISNTNASAGITPASAVVSTSIGGAINVNNFNLTEGLWVQNATSSATLANFAVAQNFQLNSNNGPSSNIEFLRTVGGSGSAGSPYQLVDLYGLAGMGAGISTNLTFSYVMNNDIDASATSNWTSGNGNAGFVPIGTLTNPFSGSFNNTSLRTINNLFENISNSGYIGLLGITFGSGSPSLYNDIAVTNANITVGVGAIAGIFAGELGQHGSATNIFTSGTITTTGDSGSTTGGVIGFIGSGTVSVNGIGSSATVIDTGSGVSVGGVIGGMQNGAAVTNAYSTGKVTGNSSSRIGGLVGASTSTVAASSLTNSFSSAYVTQTGSGNNISGFIGTISNTTTSNNYWDTQTSGQASSSGATGETTQTLQASLLTGFGSSGGTWSIISGTSYPYLTSIFPSPRVISGNVTGAAAGSTVTLVQNATALNSYLQQGTATVGAFTGTGSPLNDGYYYFMEPNSAIANGNSIVAYLSSGGNGSAITIAAAGGASSTGLNLTTNTISVGDNNTNTSTFSNTYLLANTTQGSLGSANLLYSGSGSSISINSGISFRTNSANDTYTIDNSLAVTGAGTISFAGPVTVNNAGATISSAANQTYSGTVTLSSNGVFTESSAGSGISFAAILGGANSLTINTASNNSTGISSISGTFTDTSGSNSLILNSGSTSGTLQLTNTGTSAVNSGGTLIDAGTLSIAGHGALSTGTVTLGNSSQNATLTDTSNSNPDIIQNPFTIAGSGTDEIQYTGTGSLTLSGAINGGGNLTINSANTVNLNNTIGGTTPLASLTLNGGGTDVIGSTSIITTGNQTYSDALTIGSSDTTFTSTANNINVNNSISWSGSNKLFLTASSGSILLNSGSSITASLGELHLSASNGLQSITQGTITSSNASAGVLGTISVNNFYLDQGQWFQNAPQSSSLPNFSVANAFNISTSSANYNAKFNAQFTRLNGTDPSSSSYNVIADIYGLQGVATGQLSTNYVLGNNSGSGPSLPSVTLDAAPTTNWNSGVGFLSIGYGSLGAVTNFYSGSFNGNNSVINNLTINSIFNTSKADIGLFAEVGGSGSISNLGLTNVNFTLTNQNLSIDTDVGALVGNFNSTGTLSGVYATGNISVSASAGTNGAYRIGGLIGAQRQGTTSNAYSLVNLTLSHASTGVLDGGGLAGYNAATIQTSFSAGTINYSNTQSTSNNWIGGFLGELGGTVKNSYSLTTVIASGTANSTTYLGGMIGNNSGALSTVTNNFSAGLVQNNTSSGSGLITGGFLGKIAGSNTYTGDYWDTQTSGQATSVAGTGQTTTQLQSGLPSGFTSGNGWSIITGTSYPYLNTIFTSTPRVISGNVTGAAAGNKVTLAQNGVALTSGSLQQATATVGAFTGTGSPLNDGYYYFLEGSSVIANGNSIVTYLSSGGNGSAISVAATGGASSTGLNLATNTISVGDNNTNTSTFSNTYLLANTTQGSLGSANLLYSGSGSSISINSGISFRTNSANDTYTIDNSLAVTGAGTISFAGPVTVNNAGATISSAANQTYSGTVTLSSNGVFTESSAGSGISFAAILGGANSLTINTASNNSTGISSISGTFTDTSGSNSLILNSGSTSGTLQLTNTGTSAVNSGGTLIDAGTLSIAGHGALSTGTVTLGNSSQNATLTDTSNSNPDIIQNPFTIAGSGTDEIQYTGTGSFTLSGLINGGGNLTINSANTINLNSAIGTTTKLASLTLNGGGADVIGSSSIITTGSQTYSDAVTLNASSTWQTYNSGSNITITSGITWASGQNYTLNLGSTQNGGTAGTITINGAINAVNGGATGTLNLTAVSAGTNSAGITTGANGSINVYNFNLVQGGWYQDQTVNTLPTFTASNSFELNGGAGSATSVQFIRAANSNITNLGQSGNPIQIAANDVYELQGIGSNATTLNDSYILEGNIDASGTSSWNGNTGFVAIGIGATFNGSLSGNTNVMTINGLYENGDNAAGLFMTTGSSSTIQNIGLTNVSINDTGGNSLTGVGALVGENNGSISNTFSTGALSVTHNNSSEWHRSGGLVGYNAPGSSVSNSYSTVNVTVNTNNTLGAVVGGFVGLNTGNISNSFSTGNVSATIANGFLLDVGGFAGENENQISNSYSVGNVIAINNSASANSQTHVAGFSGYTAGGTISDSYSIGSATSSGTFAVALFGFASTNGTLHNNFWDSQTSGISTGGTTDMQAITTANMMTLGTFTGATWSIAAAPATSSTWGIVSGSSFPYLTFEYTTPTVISGYVPGANPNGSSSGFGGVSVNLATGSGAVSSVVTNGLTLGSVSSSNNGFYYFFEPNGVVAASNTVLVYTANANAVDVYPSSLSSGIAGLNLTANQVMVGDTVNTESLSNATVSNAFLNISNNLYGNPLSTNNIVLNNNVSLATAGSNVTYTINGSLTATGTGALTFAGPVTINNAGANISAVANQTYSGTVTLGSSAVLIGANITLNAVTGSNVSSYSLTLDTTGTSSISGLLSGTDTSLILNQNGDTGTLTLNDASSNTYGAGTTIDAGTLSIINSNELGSSSATITLGATSANATLQDTDSSADSLSNPFAIAGSGVDTIQYTGSGAFGLSGAINGAVANTSNLSISSTGALTVDSIGGSTTLASLSLTASTIGIGAANTTFATGAGANHDITINSPLAWANTDTLTITSGNNIYLGNSSAISITAANGTLNLNAVSGGGVFQSITTGNEGSTPNTNTSGAGVTATVNVQKFNLQSGDWYQNASTPIAFSATNFELNSGNGSTNSVQFLRVSAGSGSSYSISDVYGLQGIDSNATTLGYTFTLSASIDATATSGWNSGAGFIPIGTAATPFTGTINGSSNIYTINNLFIADSTDANVGLVGYAHASGVAVENLGLTNVNITGSASGSSVGGVAGDIQDHSIGNVIISDVYVTGAVNSTTGYAGGLVGNIGDDFTSVGGIIQDSFNAATVTAGIIAGGIVGGIPQGSVQNTYNTGSVSGVYAGGIAGQGCGGCGVAATIQDSYNMGYVHGTTESGGLLAQNNGSTNFVNSYFDAQTSGQSAAQNNSSNPSGTAAGSFSGSSGLNLALVNNGSNNGAYTGWSIASAPSSSTWGIISGYSYPYLTAFYTTSTSPSVISGYVPGANTNGSSTGFGGVSVNLATGSGAVSSVSTNGLVVGAFSSANNGFYYFFEPNGVVATNNTVLVYTSNANAVDIYPASNAISGLNLIANQVSVGDTVNAQTTFSNATLANAYLNSGANLYCSPAGCSGNNIILNSGVSLVTANNSAEAYAINGDITASGAGALTFGSPVSLGASLVTLTGSGIDFSSTITGNAHSLTLVDSGTSTFNGAVTGLNQLTTNAANIGASITSTGAQTYNGAVDLTNSVTLTSSGLVKFVGALNDTTTAGTQGLTVTGNAEFDSNVGSGLALSALTVSGSTTFGSGAAVVDTTGIQTYSNAVTLNSNFVFTGSTLTFASINGGVSGLNLEIDPTSGGSVTGVIGSNIGNVVFDGVNTDTGSYTLDGASSYTGSTTVDYGTLVLAFTNALPTSTALTLNNNALINMSGFDQALGSLSSASTTSEVNLGANTLTVGNDNTTTNFSGILLGTTGGLIKVGTGNFTLSGTTNSYSGDTQVLTGTLSQGSATAIPGASSINVSSNGSLGIGFNSTLGGLKGAGNIGISLGITVIVDGGGLNTLTGTLTGLGNLTITNGTTEILSGIDNLTGTISIQSGLLEMNNNSTLGAITVEGTGAELLINGYTLTATSLSLSGTGLSGSGALVATGSSVLNSNITLAADATVKAVGGSDSLVVNGTIDGANNLSVAGAGTFTLNGALGSITPLASITVSVPSIIISGGQVTTSGTQTYDASIVATTDLVFNGSSVALNGGSVNSTGSQTYNASVTIGSDTSLTSTSGIALMNGVSGNYNLNLIGSTGTNSFTLGGVFAVNNVAVTGSAAGNNTLIVQSPNLEQFNILNNSGTVTGSGSPVSYSNIYNLTGGNFGTTFVFTDLSGVSGLLDGGNSAVINTIDFSAYTPNIYSTITGQGTGKYTNASGNITIATYQNVNKLVGNGTGNLSIASTTNSNTIVFTGPGEGIVNDPTSFSGYNTFNSINGAVTSASFASDYSFNSANSYTVGGVILTFTNIQFPPLPSATIDVSGILSMPDILQVTTPNVLSSTSDSSNSGTDSGSSSNTNSTPTVPATTPAEAQIQSETMNSNSVGNNVSTISNGQSLIDTSTTKSQTVYPSCK